MSSSKPIQIYLYPSKSIQIHPVSIRFVCVFPVVAAVKPPWKNPEIETFRFARPIGMFGTRLHGREVHASARYINTKLSPYRGSSWRGMGFCYGPIYFLKMVELTGYFYGIIHEPCLFLWGLVKFC